MGKEFWSVAEIVEIFNVDQDFIEDLEKEKIICRVSTEKTSEKSFSLNDMERLRLAKIFMHEMDVNIPGFEVILQMRQSMIDMRKQLDTILEDIASHLQIASSDRIKRQTGSEL